MSIQVENNLNTAEHKDQFEQTTHYIPCKIDSDGPANVEKYFVPYIVNKDGELTASFRGHSLDGKKMTLPEGYRAVTVTETKRPLAEDAERKFMVRFFYSCLDSLEALPSFIYLHCPRAFKTPRSKKVSQA
ncbi:hypothetical protein HF086_017290 [Spodoptera exigua]|uniref:Uncharacterized protein n=1 Tax=Spodoptera exigua TaxID=7107 RepID=A0A922LZX3_SPOEX|nr:hypothetical protein HF086_017290 [Spodoptera exigua]